MASGSAFKPVSGSSFTEDRGSRVVRAAWVGAVVIGVLVLMVIFGAGYFWIARGDTERAHHFEHDTFVVSDMIEAALSRIGVDLVAVKSLYAASDDHAASEFDAFVDTAGILDQVCAVATVQAVATEDLAVFEMEMAETVPGFEVYEVGGVSVLSPARPTLVMSW